LSKRNSVEYIIKKVPSAAFNNVLLVLTYWKLFDGIDIPSDVAKQIVERGTSPETITRGKRFVVSKAVKSNANK
jgi:hypothetical protein